MIWSLSSIGWRTIVMARRNEINCLENIKNVLAGKTSINIYSNCDLDMISRYICRAKPNENPNDFPDFTFAGGGIEHFEVTSSKETKKGSEFKIEEHKNGKIWEQRYLEFQNECLDSEYSSGKIVVESSSFTYEEFSYDDFIYSLKRNIVKHVTSLKKNNYCDKIVFFLIEQKSARLVINVGVDFAKFYSLHDDRNALSLIKEYCNYVSYIIYFAADSIEILDLSKIDELLDKSIECKNSRGGRLLESRLNLFFDI